MSCTDGYYLGRVQTGAITDMTTWRLFGKYVARGLRILLYGMILTGVFAPEGVISGKTELFSIHLLALAGITIFCIAGSLALYWITNSIAPLRVERKDEILGLDLSQHSETILEEYHPTHSGV